MEDEKEDEKRAGRLGGTINQSISQATDLFQFHPGMPSHICGTTPTQAINQSAGGGFTIWFTKLIPHFYTPTKLGFFGPAANISWNLEM